MIVIPPVVIDSTKLVAAACSIPEPDPSQDEVVWVSGAAYTVGMERVTLDDHRRYECVTAHSGSAVHPKNDPINWQDMRATNRYAMFDQGRNFQSVGPVGAPLIAAVTPGRRCNALFLGRLQAAYATVSLHVGGLLVWQRTLGLTRRRTRSWSSYFFGEFRQLRSVLLLDMPVYAAATIRVELDNGSLAAACSSMVVGRSVSIGNAEWGAKNTQIVFGGFERDDFGNAKARERRRLPGTSQTLEVDKAQVDAVLELREDLGAAPAVWSGMDDKTEDGYAEAFLIYGFHARFDLVATNAKKAHFELDLEEF